VTRRCSTKWVLSDFGEFLIYRRSATNKSMRQAPAKSAVAPSESSAIVGDACSNLMVSRTVEP
jgi:hypothetical protein